MTASFYMAGQTRVDVKIITVQRCTLRDLTYTDVFSASCLMYKKNSKNLLLHEFLERKLYVPNVKIWNIFLQNILYIQEPFVKEEEVVRRELELQQVKEIR